jgi:hypothetical protein
MTSAHKTLVLSMGGAIRLRPYDVHRDNFILRSDHKSPFPAGPYQIRKYVEDHFVYVLKSFKNKLIHNANITPTLDMSVRITHGIGIRYFIYA